MFQMRLTIFLMLALSILPGTLAAQGPRGGDSGEYVILNAQYGNERRHVDVTNRLKDLARRDRPFRISHDSMNADPDHGRTKALRVFARGPNGRERMFEFRDGSVFDGAMFRSWGRGDWGNEHWNGGWNGGRDGGRDNDAGEYVILSAQYGSERRHVEVTDRLREMARQDVTFRLDYRTFGVDPDEGRSKSLRIFARGTNGQEQMFEYQDNSVIDGAIFRGWGGGEWGHGGWSGNWNGGDAGQYAILSAQYGTGRNHVDVTERLKELARQDQQFRMGNGTFGVDPAWGVVKTLRIYARGPNGREQMFEYREGSVVDGSQFRGWGRGEWGNGNDRWSGRWEGEEREERERERHR
jgi:hypothetical protein